MERNAESSQSEGSASGALDKLIEMTVSTPEETDTVREAFERIVTRFKNMPAESKLKTGLIDDEIAVIDQQLSAQVAAIMKSEAFREVESAWRGLAFLVQRTDFSQNIRISVMQATKTDLLEDLREAESLDQSHFFRTVYANEYDTPGGRPFGTIVGNYKFDSGPLDVELLSRVSEVAEAAHSPFVASVGPEFFKVGDWKEFGEISNLNSYLDGKDFAEWKSLREKKSSKYLGLTFPGFLLRQPYGPGLEQAKSFNFSEQAQTHEDYVWGNSAFAYASKINESFADAGWVVNISGGKNAGGLVRDLSTVQYNLGAEIAKISAEVLITDAQEKEISEAGFLSLSPYKNEGVACFFGCQSVRKPEKYDTPEATANAKLETMLAYMFPVTRVAHYLKSIQRDNIGRFVSAPELEDQLKQWLHQYYSAAKDKDQAFCAKYPFTGYDVKVAEDPSNPGWYNMDVWVQPRVILQGISGKLHLVAKVPGKE